MTRAIDATQARLETWVQMAVTMQRLMRRVEQTLAFEKVTLPQFDVLSNLWLRDDLTQQELAERLQVTKGNVCGLIDRLEKCGWVKRRPDLEDGRTNRLSLTPAGRRRIKALRPIHDVLVLQCLAPLSKDDLAQLHRAMQILDEASDAKTAAVT